jgi:hypothetical protein
MYKVTSLPTCELLHVGDDYAKVTINGEEFEVGLGLA